MAEVVKNKVNRIVQIVVNVLVVSLLIVSTFITVVVFTSQSDVGVPNFFGKMPITILTNSMKPTFVSGDMIISKKVENIDSLKENDIITFWTYIEGKKVINTHKIYEIKKMGNSVSFVTKGDNNNVVDESEVFPADIIGVYTGTKIPVLGSIMNFLQSSTGFLFCIVLPLLIFFLYQVFKFITAVVELKHSKSIANGVDEEEIKRKAIEEYLAKQNQNSGTVSENTGDKT